MINKTNTPLLTECDHMLQAHSLVLVKLQPNTYMMQVIASEIFEHLDMIP